VGGRLIVVSGTGTGIGKTHFCEAFLRALGTSGRRIAGVKPVETGLSEGGPSDAVRLDRASTFHVKHLGCRFAQPVSPHIAAREEGRPIVVEQVAAELATLRNGVDILLVELAGGLFTPLSDRSVNAHLAHALEPDWVILVAPDRLGVLHEVLSTTLAARSLSVAVSGAVLMAPERPDSSTGRNASEVTRLAAVPWATALPRAPQEDLAVHPATRALAARLAASEAVGA
jgi:dethiobiotin synthetase